MRRELRMWREQADRVQRLENALLRWKTSLDAIVIQHTNFANRQENILDLLAEIKASK